MTILIGFHHSHYRNFKAFYRDHVCAYLAAGIQNQLPTVADKLLLSQRTLIKAIIPQLKNVSQIEIACHRGPINFW